MLPEQLESCLSMQLRFLPKQTEGRSLHSLWKKRGSILLKALIDWCDIKRVAWLLVRWTSLHSSCNIYRHTHHHSFTLKVPWKIFAIFCCRSSTHELAILHPQVHLPLQRSWHEPPSLRKSYNIRRQTHKKTNTICNIPSKFLWDDNLISVTLN